ncbi:30S ribosomal protein S20 [Patescibacteria group bacterium]|nr:30S ribosomal protein S20 [Patescibacteria group bacterium]MBU1074558.1 30S ribosomal protein S20 [Patescibacteria group bacterium]MBU1951456.1 30S ribosomal protein S20 [Patescibacteria group bacterium]
MPIKQAGIKALRQSKKRRVSNLSGKNNLRNLTKRADRALEAGKKDEAKELVQKTTKALDKAAKTNLIKKNTASRRKSRLMKKLNSLK